MPVTARDCVLCDLRPFLCYLFVLFCAIKFVLSKMTGEPDVSGGATQEATQNGHPLTFQSVKVPKPLPYCLSQDQQRSFTSFLNEVEEYCKPTCGSDKMKWLYTLEGLLQGSAHQTLQAIMLGGLPYDDVIEKMRQWYAERKNSLRDSKTANFHNQRYTSKDRPYLFAIRLDSLAQAMKLPKQQQEATCIQKFYDEIPKSLRKNYIQLVNTRRKLTGDQQITEWATLRSILAEEEDSDEEDGEFLSRQAHQRYSMRQERTPYEVYLAGLPDGESEPSSNFKGFCEYCGRRGHKVPDCWRKSGKCLRCGSSSHNLSQCPEQGRSRSRTPGRRDSEFRPRSRSNSRSGPRRCYVCDDPSHLQFSCPNRDRSATPTSDPQINPLHATQRAGEAPDLYAIIRSQSEDIKKLTGLMTQMMLNGHTPSQMGPNWSGHAAPPQTPNDPQQSNSGFQSQM